MVDEPSFHDRVEGYPGRLSYRHGDEATLHLAAHPEESSPIRVEVVIERWGAERREVWRTSGVEVGPEATPDDADALGCGWPVSVTVPVADDWEPGFHLVTMRVDGAPDGRDVAHAGFVVRPNTPTTSALLVLATNTWNAYNNWGGRSLYTGGHQVAFGRPFGRGMLSRPEVERDDRKARPFRWGEEPDPDGHVFQAHRTERHYPPAIGSTGWFTFERRFVEWAERAGHCFDLAVSTDLEAGAEAVAGYELVIGVGHDEYWSAAQRRTVEAHVAGGGNYASFSGNTMFWQVRTEPGRAADTMVCHKYRAHLDDPVGREDPSVTTGMWCDPVVGDPEWRFLGGGSAHGLYYRFGSAVARGSGAFTVQRDDHWLFEGTGLHYGDLLGARDGVVGYEVLGCPLDLDEYQLPIARPLDGQPSDIEIVATAPASNLAVGEYPASISALSDQGDLEFVAERVHGRVDEDTMRRVRHGNAVMLECGPSGPDGGRVVTVGTTDWVFGLAEDPAVARVTSNVLDRLGAERIDV